jgi:hypothetical protein
LESPASESLKCVLIHRDEEARYDLAQSVLLFNVNGGFSETTLKDAALYGVPCIGTGSSAAQRTLWPELAVEDQAGALCLARALLTNPARLRKCANQGRLNCQLHYSVSEQNAAEWLRQLHTANSNLAVNQVG